MCAESQIGERPAPPGQLGAPGEAPGARPAAGSAAVLALAGPLFFLSGTAALIYQVAWQRILALHSGVGIYSIAMIVGAFMAGLGLGSQLGGGWSVRLAPRRALVAFAGLEIGIAVFGALSCPIYYDWLYIEASALYRPAWRAGILHFLGLAVPTTMMGMSLPLLVRATVFDARTAGRTIGILYGLNVLGAGLGALLAPWILVRLYGIRGAVLWAAAANVVVGLGALAIGRFAAPREQQVPRANPAVIPREGEEHAGSRPLALWIGLYALSGFAALSLEILWFRVVETAVKAYAYTFGTVLSIYLLGSAVGSLAGAGYVPRLRRPLRAFLLCQCLLLGYSGAAIVALAHLPPATPLFDWYYEYWRWYDGFKLGQSWDWGPLLKLYLLLPVLLYGPPTILMGLSFPILQRAVQDEPRTSGRKVGVLQAANILGCVAGSLLVGLVFLDLLGTTGTLRLLMAIGVLFAAVGAVTYGRRSAFPVLGAVLLTLALSLPGQHRFWLHLHGRTGQPALIDEDATGVGAFTYHPLGGEYNLSVNGKGQGALPFFGAHVLMGAVPAIVHPAPLDVAIIGLGTGGTAWAAGARPETRSVRIWEIYGSQPRLLDALLRQPGFPEFPDLRRFLADPRMRIEIADGRNGLEHEGALYDVIEADPVLPDRAYSGNLYSVEFFASCARRLKPGGIMCGWGPTIRIYNSFQRAFPYVVGLRNRTILLGSNDPIPLAPEAWLERLRSPAVAAYLGPEHSAELARRLPRLQVLDPARSSLQVNRDLFPRDEFLSP